jgi:V8-like Glu-specific endopeptidase
MIQKIQKATFKLLISLAIFFFVFALAMVGNAVAEEPNGPPEGKVPSVEAEEVEEGVPMFQEGEDEPLLRPNHPPIHQIPPMPMPYPPEIKDLPKPTDAESGVYYDATTGETVVVPLEPSSRSEEIVQDGGYNGADGGHGGSELFPATFCDMFQITNTGGFPWRMNAKLVMRFGSNWYVASGTMRDAETVLTAGHCVYDYGGYGWADEIWVYPGWDGDDTSHNAENYGLGHGTHFASLVGWTHHGNFDYDLGVIEITRGVGMLTGWFGWSYGGSCDWHKSQIYNNASYPAENCPISGLHNGKDMYNWHGHFDSCPGHQLQLNTGGGHCFDTVWGGMSGSGAYYIDGGRYVHAVCSTSNRYDIGRYCEEWESFVNYTNNTFIPGARGSAFDLQALDVNAEPATIKQGNKTTLLNHLGTNPTNGSANDLWTFRVYLSTNDNISTADTLLSTQSYVWNFGAMSSVRVNMAMVTIPYNTPPGDYWIGVIYDAATDGYYVNNDTDGWDAVPIHVTAETTPPTPNPMTWATPPYETSTSSISMKAWTASDPTAPINYYFYFYSTPTGGSGWNSSGWQSSIDYTDSGLSTNHQYCYKVKARDGNNNQTSYSSGSCDYTDIQTPTGITFGTITSTSIQARSTNTPSGLNRGSSGLYIYNATAGTSSGWKQDNNYWTSTPLSPNTKYCFRAMARNGDKDPTPYSPTSCRYTLANLPGAAAFSNVTQTSIQANWKPNGNPTGTEYYCENTTAGTNSGWTTSLLWNSKGLKCGVSYSFRVKARNVNKIETKWTSLGSQKTLPCGDPCEGNFDGDNDVDGSDLAVFAADFGRTDCCEPGAAPCEGDFDGDCDVDGSDLAVFAADFGRTDCP